MRNLKALVVAAIAAVSIQLPAFSQSASFSPSQMHFGDQTNWRPAPTSGTLIGTYRTRGPWVQSGVITCYECRLYFGSKVTFGTSFVIAPSINNIRPFVVSTSSSGSHAGAGVGQPAYVTQNGLLHSWPLWGTDGGRSSNGAAGGLGGGGLYIEARGTVYFPTGSVILAQGTTGTADGNVNADGSGGGGGGGIDIRSMNQIILDSGSSLAAFGGNGGTALAANGQGGHGGGGGFINLEALKGLTNNSLSIQYAGGSGGAGALTNGVPGGNGYFNANADGFHGPRYTDQ